MAVRRTPCSHGEILDVSAGGLRIYSPERLSGELTVALPHPDRGRLTIRARVAWSVRLKRAGYVSGLELINASAEDRRELIWLRSQWNSEATVRAVRKPGRSLVGQMINALCLMFFCVSVLMLIAWALNLKPMSANEIGVAIGLGLTAIIGKYANTPARARHAAPTLRAAAPPVSEIEQLRESHSLLKRLLHSSPDGVIFLREIPGASGGASELEFQLINPAAVSILGVPAESLIGTPASNRVPLFRETAILSDARAVLESGLPSQREEHFAQADRWILHSIARVGNGLLVQMTDVTERRRGQEALQRIAFHDGLTSLASRKRLMERLSHSVHRCAHGGGEGYVVMFLDFDRFKLVNDSLGHDAGDQLLLGISSRLRAHFKVPDGAAEAHGVVLARMGGDEFVVLVESAGDEQAMLRNADELLKLLAAPHDLSGHAIVSTASIGIVQAGRGYTSAEAVIRDADTAMYEAKSAGKGRWVLFDQRMHDAASARMRLENELRVALEQGQFELAFDPIVNAGDSEVFAYEALLRWNHPTRGRVAPEEFIPVAEETGLMPSIGDWLLRRACAIAQQFQQSGRRAVVALNMSRSEALWHDTAVRIDRTVREAGIDPAGICFEIPETIITVDQTRVRDLIASLKRTGVLVALDDFGTGHSSLHTLHELHIDILKVDKRLVVTDGPVFRQSAVINAVIDLARHLKLEVVAEGVERPEQHALLQALGCQYLQGRLLGAELDEAQVLAAAPAAPRAAA